MNYNTLADEFALEAAEAAEECTHENTDIDDNNQVFCTECGKELEQGLPDDVEVD